MNFSDLHYFLILSETRSFSATAAKVHVAQPTISYSLKRLEDELHTTLIIRDRSHQQVYLTKDGEKLIQHCQRLLTDLAALKADFLSPFMRHIRLGVPPIIGKHYFTKMAPFLLEAGVLSQIEPYEAGSAALLTALQQQKIDLALLGSLDALPDEHFHVTSLATRQFKIIVPPHSPWATHATVAFSDLKAEPFLSLSERFVHSEALERLATASHTHPHIVYHTQNVSTLKQMVHDGVGIALLTEIAITPQDDLGVLSLTDSFAPNFKISIATTIDSPQKFEHLQWSELFQKVVTRLEQQHPL